jgi:hypothetical protein
MSDDLTQRADKILEEALEATGARDPREFYRDRLRELKKANPVHYGEAVAYYRDTLLPSVAERSNHALDAWTEYGRRLAEMLAPGRTVSIDETGRAQAYDGPSPKRLILHIPDGKGRAILVGLPPDLSTAQRATYDVLVAGKQKVRSQAT